MILVFPPVRAEVKPISSGRLWPRPFGEVEGVDSCGRGWDEGTEGVQESTIVLVDMASSVSMVEWLGVMVEDMARLMELTEEELVETDDLTNWFASWIGTGLSCVPSYKVPAGSLPAEVETEGAACSESAKSTSS